MSVRLKEQSVLKYMVTLIVILMGQINNLKNMKKSLIIIFISIVFLSPQFALASWWNPFSWFNKKPVIPVEEIKVEVPQKPTPVIKPVEKKGVILNSKPTVKKTSSPINSQTKETGKENKPNPLSPVVPPTINEPKAA